MDIHKTKTTEEPEEIKQSFAELNVEIELAPLLPLFWLGGYDEIQNHRVT